MVDLSLWLPVVAIVLATAGILITYFLHRVRKSTALALWKTENIYEQIYDEIQDLNTEDQLPGEPGDRFQYSGTSDISRLQINTLDRELRHQLNQYQGLLQELENAEKELEQVIPQLSAEIPDVLYTADNTSFQLVISGVATDQIKTDQPDGEYPGIQQIRDERPFQFFFEGVSTDVFDANSPSDLREYLTPDSDPSDDIDLDEPVVQMRATNLTHQDVEFLDENLSDWDQVFYELVDDGTIYDFLDAKDREQRAIQELWNVAESLEESISQRLPHSNDELT